MLTAGVARTCLTPFWGVELTGWGYYIERRWQRVHDDLNATALVIDDGQRQAILLAQSQRPRRWWIAGRR